MDEQLAAIYGTGFSAASDNDLEKTAAAELLVKIAEEQGVDLNQFSDAQVMAMVADLTKTAGEETEEEKEKESEGDSEEEKEKESEGDSEEKKEESEEKVAEADFLGRVMAHAYVQELNNIEKQAAVPGPAGLGHTLALKALKAKMQARGIPHAISSAAKSVGNKATSAGKAVVEGAKKHKGAIGAGVGGLALGAGGVAAMGKKKESSALDTLAEARALEMLKEAGYEMQPAAAEKTASSVEIAVERRALEMLEASGYPVEWNQ